MTAERVEANSPAGYAPAEHWALDTEGAYVYIGPYENES